ncbi:YceK/YidQ family lipoprotein [Pseudomonas putida]
MASGNLAALCRAMTQEALMKQWIAILLATTLTGCGTVRTVSDESQAVDDLARWGSNCHSIPRIYSGVAYQYCNLDGPPRAGAHWAPFPILVDMAASGIADTVLLPYSGYQQYKRGNISIRRLEY